MIAWMRALPPAVHSSSFVAMAAPLRLAATAGVRILERWPLPTGVICAGAKGALADVTAQSLSSTEYKPQRTAAATINNTHQQAAIAAEGRIFLIAKTGG